MKLLLIHADSIEWEPKTKAVKDAEESEKKKYRAENTLVVFTAVERNDTDVTVENASKEIIKHFSVIKPESIVVYPYAHLSPDLSSTEAAKKRLNLLFEKLKNEGVNVYKAPFGWYKSFDLKCKGHPLAELSKTISSEMEEKESHALGKEKKLKSEWFILEPDGKLNKIEIENKKVTGFDFSEFRNLEKLTKHEMEKSRLVKEEPPHIGLMKRLELVDHEPGSDPGNLRYYPKGRLIKSLIERWVTQETLGYGAMEVETPIMYDIEHPSLKNYMNRFPARQYSIKTPNKNVFLRFAACFGQFLMAHDAKISYKDLPLRLYELTRYSFRVEQRGELAGLRRLRAFTMPDCHALCKDIEQAKNEMLVRFDLAERIQNGIGLERKDLELSIRMLKDFWDENKDYVKDLVKKWKKPALIEMWDERFFYFIFKHEWNFVDSLEKASCLTTDQIDIENGERYDINFVDRDGSKKHPLILHLSPSGSIERVMFALLEKAHMKQIKKENPVFPLWLAPTQVRLCPVSDEFIKFSENIAKKLEKKNIRIDIDDRSEPIPKKIRDAEMEWVNMIVVIGEKEKKSKKLAVRFRETREIKDISEAELVCLIKKETKGKPFKPLPLPKFLSRRPVFYG